MPCECPLTELRVPDIAIETFRKRPKKLVFDTPVLYNIMSLMIIIIIIAVENLGPINASAMDFISNLGQKISYLSGDDKEAQFLFQRISVKF